MTQNKKAFDPQAGKPAWFQLVDSDAPSAQVTKVNKKLPVIALIVTGAIAASGTFFANASGNGQSSVQSISANTVSNVAGANTNSTPAASTAGAKSHSVTNVSSPAAPAATNAAIQNPSQGGIKAPRAGGDDDEYGDDENERD